MSSSLVRTARRTLCSLVSPSSQTVTPSTSRKRKRPKQRRKKASSNKSSSPTPSQNWHGLLAFRLSRMPRREPPSPHLGLHHALQTTLCQPNAPVKRALTMARSAGLTALPAMTHATAIEVVLRSAPLHMSSSVIRADLATEAFIRLSAAVPEPSAAALTVVTHAAAADDDADRRSARGASILRFMAGARLDPDVNILSALVDLFASALDLAPAATLLHFAAENGASPAQLAELYDSLAQAAFLSEQHALAANALRARRTLEIEDGAMTRAVRIALAGLADGLVEDEARELTDVPLSPAAMFTALQLAFANGQKVHPLAFAALLRRLGKQTRTVMAGAPEVRQTYELFEASLVGSGVALSSTLSQASRAQIPSFANLSRSAGQLAMSDPTFVAFYAMRALADADGSAALARHLRVKHGFTLSRLLFSIVFETCCKANNVSLAWQLKEEGFGAGPGDGEQKLDS